MDWGVTLVVEDDEMQARALARLLGKRHARCVATAEQALEVLRAGAPLSAAIIDIALPGFSGLDLLERVRTSHPALIVLVLSASLDRKTINSAARLGASYLCKPASSDDILGALRHRSQVAGAQPAAPIAAYARAHQLSPRETEILTMAVQGLRRDVIRERLGICESTIEKTVTRLLRKCGAASLQDARDDCWRAASGAHQAGC